MGVIIYDDDIIPIEISGERFDLKRKMSHGDHRTLENEFLAMATKFQKGEIAAEAGKPTLLLLNIKGWGLRDRDSNPLPITPENINRLDNEVVNALLEEITKRNPSPKVPTLTSRFGQP